MHVLRADNVHQILPIAMNYLAKNHTIEESRNGLVLVAPGPVATVYKKPWQRVLFHSWRDANPYFHFYESLWMLAGRRDVAPLARYVGRMTDFSDNGQYFNAAYGFRWRHHFDGDQLACIITQLGRDSTTRRCVLQMYDAHTDKRYAGKDAACNLTATFQIRNEKLDMVVFCRSNDILWGAYGANAVHFSVLQEYIAHSVGVEIGVYTQVSVNWHAYVKVWDRIFTRLDQWWADPLNAYERGSAHYPLMSDDVSRRNWDQDCQRFVTADGRAPSNHQFTDPFFEDVALPLVRSHDAYKAGDMTSALSLADIIMADDWRQACKEWLGRRARK